MFPHQNRRVLPTTAEEATRRYLHVYRELFIGNAAEMVRLEKITQAFIYRLRKICPRFYEQKLPSIINQACSLLLLFDTNKKNDAIDFHKSHAIFLSILDEFKKSQPQGDVDFSQEKKRYLEKKRLVLRCLQLKKELEQIDSQEIDCDDLGDEEYLDSDYARTMNKKDKLVNELQTVSAEIALLEGTDLDQKIHFELKVKPRTMLNKLTKDELQSLEQQMIEFCNEHKDRTAMYFDISIIEGMFEKLNIAPDRFQKEQIRTMMKEALDGYRAFFREIERADRYSRYDELLNNKQLMPKEGEIYDPDDLPEDLKRQMDEQDAAGERDLYQVLESYGERSYNEKELGDELSDLPAEENILDKKAEVIERLRQKGIDCARIKEEPRDDCDIEKYLMSEDYEVDAEIANALVDDKLVRDADDENDYDIDEDDQHLDDHKPRKYAKMDSKEESETHNEEEDEYEDDESDEIECLGTVEPGDKIQNVDVTE